MPRPAHNYWFGPWARTDAGFAPPTGAVGGIDLRPVPVQTGDGFGLFAAPSGVNLPSAYRCVGDERDAADYLWGLFTTASDPRGETAPKPIVPAQGRGSELLLAGELRREQFRWNDRGHAGRVRDVLRADFAEHWERDPTLARKVLDYWCERYRVEDWREFVPPELRAHVPGRLPHETTITDAFTDTDGTALDAHTTGGGWSWTEVLRSWGISSNQTGGDDASNLEHSARAETDLSSADHYAQCVVVKPSVASLRWVGPGARFAAAANTFYACRIAGASSDIAKCVAGTYTSLASITSDSGTGFTAKMECNGTTLTAYKDGASQGNVTDSAISGNTRCGLNANRSTNTGYFADTFEAADLGGGGGGLSIMLAAMHYRKLLSGY